MSHSSSNPQRPRGGRNRSRQSDRPAEHGSRDQHERQRHHRDTETFQRPKGGPKLTVWQKILSAVGLGPKPPLRRTDRPAPTESTRESSRPPRSQRPAQDRDRGRDDSRAPREPRPPREARPPREPKAARPVIQHEVTSGRLYVGNLSYDVTETDLIELFGGLGQVRNAEVVVNRATQRSKGFAFVEMLTIDEARRAVAELHDKEYMGRKMLVTGAKPGDGPHPHPPEERPARPAQAAAPDDQPAAPRQPPAPALREDRPAAPVMGDVTTGIIRREQIQAAETASPPQP